MKLLLDIGNSEIKAAISDNKGVIIHSIKRMPYDKNKIDKSLDTLYSDYTDKKFDAAGISVVDSKLKVPLSDFISDKFCKKIVFADIELNCGLNFRYEKTLGADRVAAVISAYFNYGNFENILIVDFGTATTYSMLTGDTFLGGLITPGIYLSYDALINNTALPRVELKAKYNILNSRTEDAIRSGILLSANKSFEGIVTEFEKQYNELTVIATGGGSSLMKKITDKITISDDNLVLKGILQILNYYD